MIRLTELKKKCYNILSLPGHDVTKRSTFEQLFLYWNTYIFRPADYTVPMNAITVIDSVMYRSHTDR